LGVGIKEQTNNYYYTLVSSMGPVQTRHNHRKPAQFESAIAIAQPNNMSIGKSYTGAVFAFKEKGNIQLLLQFARAIELMQVMQKLGIRQLLTAKKFTASPEQLS